MKILRTLGLGSRKRTPAAPEIPTLAELGLANYECEGWFAVLGPARLSPEETAAYFRSELARFARLVKKAGIRID